MARFVAALRTIVWTPVFYLLTACLSTGHAAGRGALAWLNRSETRAKLAP